MAQVTVVYWRDIPAQVIVRAGRTSAKRELPPRFAEAIDRAAMRAGLTGSDAYLEAWRRGDPAPCGDELEGEAAATAAALDDAYPTDRLRRLVEAAGIDAWSEVGSTHFTPP